MRDYSKMQVIEMLSYMQANEKNTTKRNNLIKLRDIVRRCNVETYKNITNTKNGINIGNVMEVLVLKFYGLECETDNIEVKSLVNNRANELTNASVKNVIFAVFSASLSGLYQYNASDILNCGRLGVNDLLKLKGVKVATFSQMIKKINA